MSKVSIIRCASYDKTVAYDAVRRAINLIGGINNFVKPGMKVLIKPNLLSARKPEEGVDTHPEIVRAVVRLVKEAGGISLIGDSPGGYGSNINNVFEVSGIKKVAEEEGVELVRFTSPRTVEGLPITKYVFEVDRIISIPKFKTHGLTILTAAVKNLFGTVVGLHKTECHAKAPKEKDFTKIIAKVYSISKPHLNILDGVVAMEGTGPASGDLRNMKMIMASSDGVAIDACLARIMGLDPFDIHTTKEAYGLGLGEADLTRIETVGEDIKNFIAQDFRLPPTTPLKLLPKGIAESIARFVRFKPCIDVKLCTRCNLCKISCPVEAIEIKRESCRIDYHKCVRCLCCHEICPYRAVYIKSNILTKLIWR